MLLRAPLIVAHDNDNDLWENEERLERGKRGLPFFSASVPPPAYAAERTGSVARSPCWVAVANCASRAVAPTPGASRALRLRHTPL